MSEPPPSRCPHCGSAPTGDDGDAAATAHALSTLRLEMHRIREIGETLDAVAAQRRIAELSREVEELRETVARLRGSGASARGYR